MKANTNEQQLKPASGEQRFHQGDMLQNPWFEGFLTVTEYDVHHGEYVVEGPRGGSYWLVAIDSGYKLLNSNVPGWRYRQGRQLADFDEITAVGGEEDAE